MSFLDLHHRDAPLVLPNAWDHASAAILLRAGFPAIGTTSLGVAAARGVRDASGAGREATQSLAASLRRLPCPISVDVEDGYSEQPDAVAGFAAELGVAGINLEDSSGGALVEPALHAAKVAAVKERCPDLFVNARVDTYWLGQHATVRETVTRALTYLDAGADGVFVPGDLELADLATICAEVPAPVNALASVRHPVPALAEVGVRRVSTGSLLYRAALQQCLQTAIAVRDGERAPAVVSYAEVDGLATD
ncbi:isocitrate lyase/phosphoenolpyruvate mutase family protein [Modestobacter sp. I12A-02662]|uniref:isocitrate lyase/PEP mutase family protein n=1 Tax=Modestobacter sp. I12A-02662 TaxID=1730496 RepID=UPI0034DDFB38